MGKIALLLPTEAMLVDAHNYCQQHPEYPVMDIRRITTENAVSEARKVQAAGAQLIIARGLQASMIMKYTDIPVIQMALTAQEMALLVSKAKNIVHKPFPTIAVVGMTNMFCDMSYFNELYDIDLRTYYVESAPELGPAADKAVSDRVDVIIGGETVVNKASQNGIPSLFLSTTDDSLGLALKTAASMEQIITNEKISAAEMTTLLDYTYSGIIRVDADGVIHSVNPALEQMIDKDSSEMIGRQLAAVIPDFPEKYLQEALNEKKENAFIFEWNYISLYIIIVPIILENRAVGVMLTLHRTQKSSSAEKHSLSSAPPALRLDDISHKSASMNACIDMAKLYAMSDCPLILAGETGTERRLIARGIHCAGNRRESPFLDVSCAGLSVEQQKELLFGENGAVAQTEGGTLLIQDVDSLSIANQYRLYQLIRFHVQNGEGSGHLIPANVRVMITSAAPMRVLFAEKRIREDLYYLLTGLELIIPPLRQRPEDLTFYLDQSMKEMFHTYGRYHVLTAGAKKALQEYSWPGNLFQVERFCERLILTSTKRSIDEIAVSSLLAEMYGEKDAFDPASEVRGREIAEALKLCRGSREKTAKMLGISTATLWRQMKKYKIEM